MTMSIYFSFPPTITSPSSPTAMEKLDTLKRDGIEWLPQGIAYVEEHPTNKNIRCIKIEGKRDEHLVWTDLDKHGFVSLHPNHKKPSSWIYWIVSTSCNLLGYQEVVWHKNLEDHLNYLSDSGPSLHLLPRIKACFAGRQEWSRISKYSLYIKKTGQIFEDRKEIIADGGFKKIYLLKARSPDTKDHVLYRFKDKAKSEKIIDSLKRIKKVFGESNKFTIPFIFKDGKYTRLIDKRYEGDLNQFIENGPSMRSRLEVMLQVARAINEFHNQGWIHFDIKPANILYNKYGDSYRIYISDFDLATEGKDIRKIVAGTGAYICPEIFQCLRDMNFPPPREKIWRIFKKKSPMTKSWGVTGIHEGKRADIYSLGITFWRIFQACTSPPSIGSMMNKASQDKDFSMPKYKDILDKLGLNENKAIDCCIAQMCHPKPEKRTTLESVIRVLGDALKEYQS